ncbi:hypothetical protein N9N67_05990 [Bacteriovoracaceae bacterium]|nr:hypothetical protein [Bacteriovoracaceae bacterium]
MKKILYLTLLIFLSHNLFAKQLFLVRGLSRQSGHWGEDFKEKLQESLPDWNIFYLDLPGTGRLSHIKSPVRVKNFIPLMRKEISSNLKMDEDNYILGTSLGGIVVWEWISQFPQDFKQVLLVNTPFRGVCKFKERIKPKMRIKLIKTGLVSKKKIKKRESLLYDINSNVKNSKQKERVVKDWVDLQKKQPISKSTMIRQTLAGLTYRASFASVNKNIKYYIFASEQDQLTDKACYQNLSNLLKAPLFWNDWAGHGLPIDDPDWIIEKVLAWKDEIVAN